MGYMGESYPVGSGDKTGADCLPPKGRNVSSAPQVTCDARERRHMRDRGILTNIVQCIMVWNSFLLNGILSIIDMKQHIITGTQNANCCGNSRLKSARSFEAADTFNWAVSYTNPLIHSNTPDPGVTKLMDGSGWVAVATSDFASRANNSSAFPMYFSTDMVRWQLRSWVFTPASWPSWAEDSMWAPELHNVNGRYI